MRRTGRTQSSLASELGISVPGVNDWIHGRSTPKYSCCMRLMKMGIRLDELFSEDVMKVVKKTHSVDSLECVELTPERCLEIVSAGMEHLRSCRSNSPECQTG